MAVSDQLPIPEAKDGTTNQRYRLLEDCRHIVLSPKLGRLRVKGSHQRLLDRQNEIRIGTVTITKDAADRFFVSLQLGSDTPFVSKLNRADRANRH